MKYYDIETTLDKYGDSPRAIKFLNAKIEVSDPNAFHWCDVETARELKQLDINEGIC